MMIEELLTKVNKIVKSHENEAKKTGENFNIFSILDMETKEVATHSSFIAELLNPNGSHNQGAIFLKIFIELFCEDFYFDINTAKVYKEFYIGVITEEKGGRLDIFLHDNQGNKIMIENKIYAIEQENQLLRYHNFAPKGKLFYLTLKGKDSDQKSLSKDKYTSISYEKDILKWLDLCKKEVINIPLLRESINVYTNLIKKITNQNLNLKMDKDIREVILDSLESQQTAIKIAQATNSLHNEFLVKMDEIINAAEQLECNINNILNKDLLGKLRRIKREVYDGIPLISFDLFSTKQCDDCDTIKLQVNYRYDFKLRTLIWGRGKFYEQIEGTDLDRIVHVFTLETSNEIILEKIENDFKEILKKVF